MNIRKTIVGVTLKYSTFAALALGLPLGANAETVVNPTTDDLWDLSQGTVITAHSPDSFGWPVEGVLSESPLTDALFTDSQFEDYVHFLEWQTPSAIELRSFALIATHDLASGRDARYRGFKAFRLYGYDESTSSFEQLFELADIPLLYGNVEAQPGMYIDTSKPINTLAFRANLSPFVGDRFRAEFVQYSSIARGHASGPRIRELDGFAAAAVPEPSALALLSFGFAGFLCHQRRKRKQAGPV